MSNRPRGMGVIDGGDCAEEDKEKASRERGRSHCEARHVNLRRHVYRRADLTHFQNGKFVVVSSNLMSVK